MTRRSSRVGRWVFPGAYLAVAAGTALTLATVFLTGGCIHTRPFTGADGQVVRGSIATMETFTIGGVRQSVWFRGVSKANPPLILLHGGPGASESALFRHYNAAIERYFLVVYWEQRGAGRSYHRHILPESMNIAQFVRDLDELVELVRRRFDQERVVLVGHSWGTVLGTIYAHQHPDKVAAYVGIAQIADMKEAARLSYEFALAEATRRGDRRAIAKLEALDPTIGSVDQRLALGKLVARFGGTFHGDLSTGRLIWTAIGTDEANLVDLVRFGQGNRFSLEQLEDETAHLNLAERYRDFRIPIVFLLGRHDWHVPSVLAEQYFARIKAPCKRLVWFEQSAHHPPFEEPEQFNTELIGEVRRMVEGACPG